MWTSFLLDENNSGRKELCGRTKNQRIRSNQIRDVGKRGENLPNEAPRFKQSIKEMVDFTELPDGEVWEHFARDFLAESGFQIETSPDRGADAGKDFLVTERLVGRVNTYPFRWLVSCKHFAKSGKSVSEQDEPNIRERLESFRADGFLGFYSTIPSSGLNSRLMALRNEHKIRDYRIFG